MNTDPFVSFLILSYNQPEYITDAIQSALKQNYEKMEVIVSDDCSTDNTYSIINKFTMQYFGHKSLTSRTTDKNLGTFLHLCDAVSLCRGDLIILSGGDDISKSCRTEVLVKRWKETGAWGLCSSYDLVDKNANILATNLKSHVMTSMHYRLRQYLRCDPSMIKILHGATSAYDKRVFDILPHSSEDYILSEDGVLSIFINMVGKNIVYLPESLVLYRQTSSSLTNGMRKERVTLSITRKEEDSISRLALSQANRCRFFLRVDNPSTFPVILNRLNRTAVLNDLKIQTIKANWYSYSFFTKILKLFDMGYRANLSWFLPRLLPKHLFIAIKTFTKSVQISIYRVFVTALHANSQHQ